MTLLEQRINQFTPEKDWEELYDLIKEYFSKDGRWDFTITFPDPIDPEWYKKTLEEEIEARLGIPKSLRGKGLIRLDKEITKEYHDRVYSNITIHTLQKKEDIIDKMCRLEIYEKFPTLRDFLTGTPPWYVSLRSLINSGIFPFRTQLL